MQTNDEFPYNLQATSYNTSIVIKRKLAVNHPIYQHFTSDELNKFRNCNHCSKSYSMATSSNSLTSLKYHLNTKRADKVQSSPIEITPSFPASKLQQRTLFATKTSTRKLLNNAMQSWCVWMECHSKLLQNLPSSVRPCLSWVTKICLFNVFTKYFLLRHKDNEFLDI